MTDLVPYSPQATSPATAWVAMLEPAADLARQIAATEFVPASMRGKPAAVAACILYGQELGIGPMQALAKVHIVEGRPAPSAELGRALALSAGHEVWIEEQTNTKVTVAGRRRGGDTVQRVTWTMDDAKRAGLDGRQNYRRYPRQMLLARASAELVRIAFPDVLGGIAQFAEELEDDGPADPGPIVAQVAPSNGTVKRKAPGRTPAPPAATPAIEAAPTAPELPALPGEPEQDPPEPAPEQPTQAQIRKLMATYRLIGVENAHDQKALAASIVGRETLDSHKHLTIEEASTLIDRLIDIEEGRQAIVWGDNGPTGTIPVPPDDTADELPL